MNKVLGVNPAGETSPEIGQLEKDWGETTTKATLGTNGRTDGAYQIISETAAFGGGQRDHGDVYIRIAESFSLLLT